MSFALSFIQRVRSMNIQRTLKHNIHLDKTKEIKRESGTLICKAKCQTSFLESKMRINLSKGPKHYHR